MKVSENLDLVRSIYADWERGDFSRTDWANPEIEFVTADGPQPGQWMGLAGMAEGWRAWLSAWADFRGKADGYRELDGERIVVSFHFTGTGKSSGLELGQMTPGAGLFHIRDGKVIRYVVYFDRANALADLGLEA